MRYVDALKIWNQTENNGKWCFPSKGTESHKQVLEIMKGKPLKEPPKKETIKIKKSKIKEEQARRKASKKQVGDGMSVWDLPEFRNEFKKYSPEDLRQMGYGMEARGLILPSRQQRGRGGDLPWDVILDVIENPMKYVNKAGQFLDSQNASKQMAKQIESETGAKRLFKFPWE